MTRVVIGVPLHNGGRFAEPALRSLLAQRYPEVALLLIDDGSSDGTAELAHELAAEHPNCAALPNDERLGMVDNWRRCVAVAVARHPEADYFAWGSDHDLWDPDWLAALVGALDSHPEAVLAYPLNDRIDGDGAVVRSPSRFDTLGIVEPARRIRAISRGMGAGNIVYGLFRTDELQRAGVFRHVLAPDRLLLTELAFRGQFVQVERVLWHRRTTAKVTRERQRRTLFSDRAPWYTRLPPNLVHTCALLGLYVLGGYGKPEVGRLLGARLSLVFATGALAHMLRRRYGRIVRRHRARRRRARAERSDRASRRRRRHTALLASTRTALSWAAMENLR